MRRFAPLRAFMRLYAAEAGLALTEFALIAPVMIVLYFGTVEITQAVIAKRKLNLVAMTLGDLTARLVTVGTSDISDIFGAAATIMAPVDASPVQMRISSVIVSPSNTVCVDWSVGRNMTALAPGSSITMPSSITSASSTTTRSFILAEASLSYRPATKQVIRTNFQLKEGPTYLVPRQSDRVVADSTIQASSPCA